MLETFTITLSQILVLFAFIIMGYVLKKTVKPAKDFNKGLSALLVNVFLPCLIFRNISKNFKVDIIGDKINIVLISTALVFLFFGMAYIFAKLFAKERQTQDIYIYSFTFPNSSYFGNPLVLALFGEMLLFDYIIFCIPFFFFTYTIGICFLSPNRTFAFKNLLNPNMIALVLGMLAGLMNVQIPAFLASVMDTSANCMAPSAMILTGIVFASNHLKEMVSNRDIYIACFIKLVLVPLIAVFLLAKAKVPEAIAVLIIMKLSLPTGLNSIVFPEAYGGDSRTGAQLCFVSTMTCLVFIPFIFAFYHFLCA